MLTVHSRLEGYLTVQGGLRETVQKWTMSQVDRRSSISLDIELTQTVPSRWHGNNAKSDEVLRRGTAHIGTRVPVRTGATSSIKYGELWQWLPCKGKAT